MSMRMRRGARASISRPKKSAFCAEANPEMRPSTSIGCPSTSSIARCNTWCCEVPKYCRSICGCSDSITANISPRRRMCCALRQPQLRLQVGAAFLSELQNKHLRSMTFHTMLVSHAGGSSAAPLVMSTSAAIGLQAVQELGLAQDSVATARRRDRGGVATGGRRDRGVSRQGGVATGGVSRQGGRRDRGGGHLPLPNLSRAK